MLLLLIITALAGAMHLICNNAAKYARYQWDRDRALFWARVYLIPFALGIALIIAILNGAI